METRTKKYIFFCLKGILFLSCISCAELKLSNTSTGLYGYKKDSPSSKDILDVNVGIIPIPNIILQEENPKTFWDLRDSIPHLYLKILSEKIKDADTFIGTISKPLSVIEKKETKAKTDYRDIKVRFVFSNIKKYYENKKFMHPNTRLEFLNTTLEIKNNDDAYFYSIDKLENEFEEIDLGTIDRSQEVKFQTNLSAESGIGGSSNSITGYDKTSSNENDDGAGNTGSNIINKSKKNTTTSEAKSGYKADVSYANNESIKEAVNGKIKRMKTGFSFSSDKITVSQRGAANRDISDNVYVTATLRLEDNKTDYQYMTSFKNLYDDKNTQVVSDKIEITQENKLYIKCYSSNDIEFSTKYSGAIRAVNNTDNDNSYLEFDDNVTFYRISGTTDNIKLKLNKNIFCKKALRIVGKKQNEKKEHVEYRLYIETKGMNEIFILDDDAPYLFISWLQNALKSPTLDLLKTNKFSLLFINTEDRSDIIQLTGKDMNQNSITKLKNFNLASITPEEIKN